MRHSMLDTSDAVNTKLPSSATEGGEQLLSTDKYVTEEGFTTLSDGGQNPTIDIVFVHGLQGHPAKTWTSGIFKGPADEIDESSDQPTASKDSRRFRDRFSRKNKPRMTRDNARPGVFWPDTLLKTHEDCQTARIMTYGYDSDVIRFVGGPANLSTISDHGETLLLGLARTRVDNPIRPLMFFVHSLGGLVLKSALVRSLMERKEDLRAIHRATFAIIFFGTPHRGSAYASMGTTISKIAHFTTGKPVNTSIVTSLNRNNEISTNLRKGFGNLLDVMVKEHGFESSTFQESVPVSTGILALDGKIVDDDSSEMNHTCDRNDHINRNHMDMCKFSGPRDPEYAKVHGEIKRHITRLRGLLNREREICLNSLYNEELDLRQSQIGKATEYTLKWIFSGNDQPGPGLAAWLQNGNGFFWINGRPGSGKSTAMKYLVENSMTQELLKSSPRKLNLHYTDEEWVMINLFFTDRGSASQRSGESILRRMLFQLLKAKPSLIDDILRFGKRKKILVPVKDASKFHETADALVYEWNEVSLKQALLFCRNQNAIPFRCCIFLDGLDEHEGDHKKFGTFILSLLATDSEPGIVNIIKICVASRPEQVFQDMFEGHPSFAMQDYTNSDIRKHLDKILGGHPSLKGIGEQRRGELTAMYNYIVHNAYGVFLWADSVATEIYTGLENGETFARLWELLNELPTDIEKLYKQILEKIDPGLRVRAYIMLETVLRARTPLTLLQLTMIVHVAQNELMSQRACFGVETAEFTDAQRLSRQLVTSCRCILERQPQKHSPNLQRSWTFRSDNSDDIDHIFEPRRRFTGLLSDIEDDDFGTNSDDPDAHSYPLSPSDGMSEKQSWRTGQSTDLTETGDFIVPKQSLSRAYDSEIEEMEHAQFRTYDDRPSTDPATDHVQLLHRSVRDFLLGEGSLNGLFPKENADSALGSRKPPGNGHLYMLMFSRAWLKFPNATRRQLRCEWEVAVEAPYHACQLEATFPDYDPLLLEDIDAEASIKSPLRDTWPDEWFLDRYRHSISHWTFTFPAFAVAKGLTRYLGYILSKSPTSAEKLINSKAGRPLLHFAIYMTGEDPQPSMVRFLLSRGANVNAQFENKTALESFIIPECERNGEPHFSVIAALLEGGADVNSRYYPNTKITVHGWHPLLHVVGYASQTIDLSHRLLFLDLLLKHDVDMNAKDGFGRSFLEVLYWNDKRLPSQFWQLILDKEARITRAMVTRDDLYSQTDTNPTIFSHLWTPHGHLELSSLGIDAFNGVLLVDPKLGSKITVSRSWAGDQFPMRSDEEEEEGQFGHQKKAKYEEELRRKSNEDEDEGENEQDQGDIEEQRNEEEIDPMFSDWDEKNYITSNSEFSLTQDRRRPDFQRSKLYSLLHVPFEARAAPGALLGEEKLSGKKTFEVFDLGILDKTGPSGTSQDAYKILRQEVFRKEKYYTPEAAKRVLEIDPAWFVERVEVQPEPEPEPERLLAKWRRHMPF